MTTSVLRFEKIKSFTAINLSESHVYRFSYTPNANAERTQFNRVLIGKSGLSRNIQRVFNKLEVKPRKNAVLAMDCILSLSNDAFTCKADINKFCEASKDFLDKTFKGRCISAVIHLDETTPHIHALILPLEKNNGKWKLNARNMFGKTNLSRYQKDYYSYMKSVFPELTPPLHGRKASHESIKNYYNSISLNLEKSIEMQKNLNDVNIYDNRFKSNKIYKSPHIPSRKSKPKAI
ncbi:MobV family relaxase [Vibrio parahaemolyticus]|uniref:MobV family relaxase n=1 Tax=Vibrio parahaemolyticus TaxID=670 RepID=UPI001B8342DD|nr:MobV family relaxase [Vibrio parahaemolyticus]EHR1014754.1 plasmid recombination protein [Vibrio parahaemolyticus]EHR6401433.1 plasmid recombination protein [Vibrio parahaemolyticus]EJQ8028679.1 plasmid recombination protein [Vibrio parahaemolyticus]HBC3366436.1 plasmid recombination protein [Vibrio parahaemolyticus]HCE1959608.1 plasmid recombination protein [Vibrio parahaemolyticus]